MISGDARAIVLLGAQRFNPTLAEAVADLRVDGRIATITAGWQEREEEDEDLREDLGDRTVNLRLHARAEEIFRQDPDFAAAHRERQEHLRHRQDFYRIRLEHALDAQHMIAQRKAPDDMLEDEERASIDAIRSIDSMHLEGVTRERKRHEDKLRQNERAAVVEHRAQIAEIVRGCDAIAIAGGHVASLLNRLRLFNIENLARGKVIFAWCAGAMAISERVVLFHDSPPQGQGAAEVLEAGLGLVGGVVVLPQPEFRLKLNDRERLKTLARRFAPAMCLALPARSRVTWLRGGPADPYGGVFAIREDGTYEARKKGQSS